MEVGKLQHIVVQAYPNIQNYFGKGKLDYPTIEFHKDIYARLGGIPGATGEHSDTSIAQYDKGVIYIY